MSAPCLTKFIKDNYGWTHPEISNHSNLSDLFVSSHDSSPRKTSIPWQAPHSHRPLGASCMWLIPSSRATTKVVEDVRDKGVTEQAKGQKQAFSTNGPKLRKNLVNIPRFLVFPSWVQEITTSMAVRVTPPAAFPTKIYVLLWLGRGSLDQFSATAASHSL